jgi:hypothetical protein
MEKKEQHSMKKHRGLFLGLGLVALLGLSASESRAETMTLTVSLNGTQIYSVTGADSQSVTADTSTGGALNSALLGTGYVFTGLSGSSNWTSTTGGSFSFVSDSGILQAAAGGTGGTLTIVVSEDGFVSPASGTGNQLISNQTAIFTGATSSSTQTYVGNFTDSGSVNQNLGTSPASLLGTTSAAQAATGTLALGAYATPFTLTNTTTITLGSASTDPTFPGNVNFTGTTSVTAGGVIPEPASLVMMVTGMPLPLVVMGLLRRRRAAAA